MSPSIDPPIHSWVGVSPQIINLQTKLNYIDKFKLYSIFSDLTPPMHPPIGGGVSIDHKSSNRIELSWLSQDLFNI